MKPTSLVLSLLLLSTATLAVAEEERVAVTLEDGKVSFTIPPHWSVIGKKVRENGEVIAFQVPNAADEGTGDSANVSVFTQSSPGLTLDDFSNHWIESIVEDPGAVLLDRLSGDEPSQDQSAFMRAQQGQTPYIVADRYVRRGELFVHFRASWPLLENTKSEWTSSLIAKINDLFSRSLIDGAEIGEVGRVRKDELTRPN